MAAFISYTHDRYASALGEPLGEWFAGFFADEIVGPNGVVICLSYGSNAMAPSSASCSLPFIMMTFRKHCTSVNNYNNCVANNSKTFFLIPLYNGVNGKDKS